MTADGRLPEESRRNYKHVFDALWKIKKDEGIKGLWRGTTATVFRAMTANVTQLMSYDAAKSYLMKTRKSLVALIELLDGTLNAYKSVLRTINTRTRAR